jgi:hypothetical protein
MHKIFAAITFAFLLGVTIAGCSQVADFRKGLESGFSVGVTPDKTFPNAADRGE